ncbi:MAG: carbohydrate kinase [Proteocatella sp.]
MKKYDITALGEILIDYTPLPKSKAGMQAFEQNPGGAPANVLACAAKLGFKTAFIGKIGCDMQGDFLRSTLEDAGIETRCLISDPDFFTTLAFVSLSDSGERSFSFARKPGADTRLCASEVDIKLIEESRIFHFGSLSLTDNPAREATIFALEQAKKSDIIISYDPNYRPLLWKTREDAMEKMRSVLKYVDVIKISDEETQLVSGESEPVLAAKKLIELGIPLVAVTLGCEGAIVANKEGHARIAPRKVTAIDTTGAGDAFWGGFLYSLGLSGKKPSQVSLDEAASFGEFANAVASICVQGRGAIPSMPSLDEVELLLGNK